MATQQFKNGPVVSSPSTPSSTLFAAITAGVTSLTVVSAAAFPATPQFTIAIDNELLLVTGVAGAVFTVTRGVEGTSAASHTINAGVFLPVTAASLGLLPALVSDTGITYGGDTLFARGGSAGQMTLSAGSTAPSLRLKNGSNAELGAIYWDGSNNFVVGTQGAVSGGTARDTIFGSAVGATNGIYLATEATSRWNVNPSGHLVPFITATYDLGTSSAVVRAAYLGSLTLSEAGNVAVGTSTGTKIGTATAQKLGLWNAMPIIQPAAAGQAAFTDSTGGVAAAALVDVTTAGLADPAKINANFATLAVLLLAIRTAMVNFGSMKGSS